MDLSNRKVLVPQSGSGVCFTTHLSSVTLVAGSLNTEPEQVSCLRKQPWHDYLDLQAHQVRHCDPEAVTQGAAKVKACIQTSQPGRDQWTDHHSWHETILAGGVCSHYDPTLRPNIPLQPASHSFSPAALASPRLSEGIPTGLVEKARLASLIELAGAQERGKLRLL